MLWGMPFILDVGSDLSAAEIKDGREHATKNTQTEN